MKHFYLITLFFFSFNSFGQFVIVNGCNSDSIDGLYAQTGVDATGRNTYEANRYCYFCSPQRIYFDAINKRWVIAAWGLLKSYNYNTTSPNPPETGWVKAEVTPCPTPPTLSLPRTVESKSCSACRWSDPATWEGGVIPTTSNHVLIKGSVLLDSDVSTLSLTIQDRLDEISNQSLIVNGLLTNQGFLTVSNLTLRGYKLSQELKGNQMAIQRLTLDNDIKASLVGNLSVLAKSGDIKDNIFLNAGSITLGDYNLTCHGVKLSKYASYRIITNGSGHLTYQLPGGPIRADFPIASVPGEYAQGFTPILITGVANTGSNKQVRLSARVGTFDKSHTLPENNRYVPVEWSLSSDHETLEQPFTLNFGYPGSPFVSVDFNYNTIYVKRWNGSLWETKTGPKMAEVYTGQGYANIGMSAENVTEFSSWALFDGESSLPVRLVYFKGRWDGPSALLSWTTTEEKNSQKFEVQHSLTGEFWQNIGEIPAKGNSTGLQQYAFRHFDLNACNHYYRLKMIDYDGSVSFSRVVSLAGGTESSKLSYPNPVVDHLHFHTESSISKVTISTLTGRVISEHEEVINGLSVKHLPDGLYVCTVAYTDGRVKREKIIVNR